jgi:hypothetical protein
VGNAVVTRLEDQRTEQFDFIDTLLAQVDTDGGRDLVPAEEANLAAARERIAAIDRQLAPLREYESLRAASADGHPMRPRTAPAGEPRPLGADGGPAVPWQSPGAFIVDHLAARGVKWAGRGPDQAAQLRIERAAVSNNITTDVPGLLPQPIIGPVVGALDTSRPFVTSIGAKPMGGIPGAQFSRPRITQHVLVGKQAAQKTQLASQPLKITPVPFIKETFGGTVDVARQFIDWTSPSAWDALITDLAAVYGMQTEIAAATAFATAVTQATAAVATNDLAGWTAALYEAAGKAFLGGAALGSVPMGQMPDRIWVSLDMWQTLGAIVDAARMAVFANAQQALGAGDLASFAGDILNLPRIVVWSLPAQTVIVGNSTQFEFYEEVIGLLSAVEPSLLGVEVAYGGYAAYAPLLADAFCKVTPPAVIP